MVLFLGSSLGDAVFHFAVGYRLSVNGFHSEQFLTHYLGKVLSAFEVYMNIVFVSPSFFHILCHRLVASHGIEEVEERHSAL